MTSLDINKFFPEQLKITEISETKEKIIIKLVSQTKQGICPCCGVVSEQHHGTYFRRVKDLPMMGKAVTLQIKAFEYNCEEPDCNVTSLRKPSTDF